MDEGAVRALAAQSLAWLRPGAWRNTSLPGSEAFGSKTPATCGLSAGPAPGFRGAA